MEKIFLVLFVIFLCAAMGYGGISALDLASISRAKSDEIRQNAINQAVQVQTQEQLKLLEMQAQAAERQAKIVADAQAAAQKQQAQSVWLSVVPIFAIAGSICAVLMVLTVFVLVISRINQKANPPNRIMIRRPQHRQLYYQEYPQLEESQYYYPEAYQAPSEYTDYYYSEQ